MHKSYNLLLHYTDELQLYIDSTQRELKKVTTSKQVIINTHVLGITCNVFHMHPWFMIHNSLLFGYILGCNVLCIAYNVTCTGTISPE